MCMIHTPRFALCATDIELELLPNYWRPPTQVSIKEGPVILSFNLLQQPILL